MNWDEFGLGSPAIDFVVFAFDCTRAGAGAIADRLLTRAEAVSGHDGGPMSKLPEDHRERLHTWSDIATIEHILHRLDPLPEG